MKKILALTLTLIMAFAFCACGQVGDGDDAVLSMATNAFFPPYEYYENDAIVGIDAEIAAAIAAELGMKLEIKDMEFNSIIDAVKNGKVDIGMAGMTVTEDRLVNVNFSTSYAKGIQVVIVKAGGEVSSLDDLAGKKIGVQMTTTGDIYATDEFGEDAIVRYSTGNDAVLALTQGKVQAVIIDNEPAKAYVAANEGLTIIEAAYADEDYAIAIHKKNEDLLNKINAALQTLTDNGTIAKIVEKYIPSK